MNELQRLIELAGNLGNLNDEELAQLLTDLTAAANDVANAEGGMGDAELAALDAAAEAADRIRAEQGAREQAAAEAADRARQALERINAQEDDGGDGEGGDGTGDGGEPDAQPDGGDAGAGEGGEGDGGAGDGAGDGSPAGEGEGAGDGGGEPGGEGAEAQPVPIAAGAARPAGRVRVPPLSRVAARRPAEAAPRPDPATAEWSLTASANVPGVPAGQRITTEDQLANAFVRAADALRTAHTGPRMKVPVVTASVHYPDEFQLGSNPRENVRRIEEAQAFIRAQGGMDEALAASAQGVTAAGGICAPQNVRYDLPTLGSEARPVRDRGMVRFAADRGGIATLPPPVINELDGAVDVWTEANDQNPTDPTTKPCLEVTCPSEDETVVEAITRCLQFGNFRARFFPEQIAAWTRLASVRHARLAEVQLLTKIGGDSTQVATGPQVLGAVADVLATLDRASIVMTNFHREDPSAVPLTWMTPYWLKAMMRTDLVRRMPGGMTTDEQMAVADEQIERWIRARGITPVWFLDGESGQLYARQGNGLLVGWKSTVVTYLYPTGSWLFLDGGELDLGLVRDSTLNATNDVQLFSETFEGGHFHGHDTWRLTLDLCPDGTVSSTRELDICATGS